MNSTGYQRLIETEDDFLDQEDGSQNDFDNTYNPFREDERLIPPSTFRTITMEPVSTSAPTESLFGRRNKDESTDLEEQRLLPNSYHHTPFETEDYNRNNSSSVSVAKQRQPSSSKSLISLNMKGINKTVSKWTHSLWTSNPKISGVPTEIHYSVFKPPQNIRPIKRLPPDGFINSGPVTQYMFDQIVQDAIYAIDELNIKPKRIKAGSSGSYFIYDKNNEITGVFKPKDEEPYGPLSPKWTKWLHRNLFPCFFGRSCLIPNLGYICESAACLLDRQLRTFIVPFTDVVSISSDSFYYSYWERRSKKKLRSKIGSFQLFLHGYMEADKFLEKYPFPGSRWSIPALYYPLDRKKTDCAIVNAAEEHFHDGGTEGEDDMNINLDSNPEFQWTSEVLQQFREELEKLVILDYIMRNTDRGLDNWMIKVEWETRANGKKHPVIKIGAIDSGLAFPWKHPDEWRSYPFGWLFLPVCIIGQPFSERTRKHFLPLLTSTAWWEECSVLFRNLFAKDSDFKERMWKKQWAVMKGQAFNVVETLKNPTHGPLELARKMRVLVQDQQMEVSVTIPVSMMQSAMNTPLVNPNIKPVNGLDEGHQSSSLEIIDENDRLKSPKYVYKLSKSYGDEEELQKNWNHYLKGDINETEFQSPKSHLKPAKIIDINTGQNEDVYLCPSATKMVIIERIKAVTSKPPVFTCC